MNKHVHSWRHASAFVLALLTGSVAWAADELYITEYIEGSSNNKALEFYNNTGSSIDLTPYTVEFYFNGNPVSTGMVDLVGAIADGEVFVLAQSAANAAILAVADQVNGGSWFNGDDAVVLRNNGAIVDVIGQVGFDPGSQWGAGDTSTQNNTLRRLETVTDGDTDDTDVFDPALEWVGFAQDNSDGLGFYPGTGGGGPMALAICEIQGAGHISAFDGQSVETTGIVVASDFLGYYLQSATSCDADEDTSDGIFVFTNGGHSVSVGDELMVSGTVSEFIPGGASSNNLSITEIVGPTAVVVSSGNALPAPALIGAGGRTPPVQVIDNDNFAVFDPAEDGIDFYESFEGMRVTLVAARAVSATSRFNGIYTVVDDGVAATRVNPRGGITIAADDFNPERVQIQFDDDLTPGFVEQVSVGDFLGDVTGVMSYSFGNPEVLVTEPFVPMPGNLTAQTTSLSADGEHLTIASYNVLNLDPKVEDPALTEDGLDDVDDDVGDGRFDAIAAQIVNNLNAPDIVALQEVQDSDGAELTGVTDSALTLSTLTDALAAAGVSDYVGFDLPPVNLTDGGQPGGNIRVAYLYRSTRVLPVPGSTVRLMDDDLSDGDAFEATRKPLAADFMFNGQTIALVNMHSSSKSGSSPLFGALQPPVNGRVDLREAQSEIVNAYVDTRFAEEVPVVVLGDMNEFFFEAPLAALKGEPAVLSNLTEALSDLERYTFAFDGNSQALDHVLVSNDLTADAQYEVVHVNSEFPSVSSRASDHDPLVVRLAFEDADGDGVTDSLDNCLGSANVTQQDDDADGIGNLCDGDFNNDCAVNFLDLAEMKAGFFMPGETDMDSSGNTDFTDLAIFKSVFLLPPGPSGVPNICEG